MATGAVADDGGQPLSTGLAWAGASLLLDVLEVLVLSEILFFDRPRAGLKRSFGLLEVYFIVTVVASLGQAAGVALVAAGRYRAGGYLQIASSAVQVVRIDGIPGVVGGVKALRYARAAGQ